MAVPTDTSEDAVDLVSGFTARQSPIGSCVKLVEKWRELFNAYDMRESGSVSFGDYMKLEIRNGLEQGDFKRLLRAFPTISRADPSLKRGLDFLAFCKTRMSSFDDFSTKGVVSSRQLMQDAENDLETTMAERFRMGPEYCWEIRKELKEVFASWRSNSEGLLPSDWLMANRIVEMECDMYLAEKWTGEAAFQAADGNGDGMIQFEEFLPFSMKVLQKVFSGKSQDALQALRKVMSHPIKTLPFSVKIKLFLPHPPFTFQLPNFARHVDCSFWHADTLELPSSISEVEDLCSLLRLKLKLVGMTFSAFWIQKSVELLCVDNCKAILRSVFEGAKQTESFELGSIVVKNIRSRTSRLKEIQLQQLPVNAQCSYSGMRWCLNWEAHLIGMSGRKPARLPYDFVVGVGDVIAIQLPGEESGILWKVFVEDALHNKPCLEQQEVVKGKKGKKIMQMIAAEKAVLEGDGVRPPKGPKPSKKRPQSGAVIPTQKEGTFTVLLEMSWEHQEGVLAESASLPAAEASVGRLGPLRVMVEKTSPKVPQELKAKGVLWWTGTRWSPTPLKLKRPKSAR